MSAETSIRKLVEAHLTDNHNVRGVEFIDQLLPIVRSAGQVSCTLADDRRLRFQVLDQPPWEVELERARTKLRMLCARLSVLCNESGGPEVSLYGGEGSILKTTPKSSWLPSAESAMFQPGVMKLYDFGSSSRPKQTKWSVRFKNTPSEHEFAITAE